LIGNHMFIYEMFGIGKRPLFFHIKFTFAIGVTFQRECL